LSFFLSCSGVIILSFAPEFTVPAIIPDKKGVFTFLNIG